MLNVNDSCSYAVQQESSGLVAGVTQILSPASAVSSPQNSPSGAWGEEDCLQLDEEYRCHLKFQDYGKILRVGQCR